MTKAEYEAMEVNKGRIQAKLLDILPSTVGVDGKMLRPLVHVWWDSGSEEYRVSISYEEGEF